MSKPMFIFLTICSVRSHTFLMLSPTLSSGLFAILAFRPLSALIDAPEYSGTCPSHILAQFRNHILCKPPHPLPRLRAPVSSLIMEIRIERQLILTPMTMSTSLDVNNPGLSAPISMAFRLNPVQSHLPTLAPFLAPPKGFLSRQKP